MEATMLQVFLRVLYTVNSNPQYILAKSSSQVPAVRCNDAATQSAHNNSAYAHTPLKACLAVVCDSSPELLQDPTRDFSLYVLDPLEAQPVPTGLAPATRDASSPRGVAVALGPMSWALESHDSANVFATGTIVPHASPALEVVFALRETKRMPRPIFHSYPPLSSIHMPGPSQPQPSYPPCPPHVAGMNWSSVSQEQRTLTRSADFPELYIGPPRRARGRPEGSTSSKSKVTSQTNASSLPGEAPSSVVGAQTESQQDVGKRAKQKSKSRPPRAQPMFSPFICAPLTRHTSTGAPAEGGATDVTHPVGQHQMQSHAGLHPQAQPFFHPTQNPLLSLLSAIPSISSGTVGAGSTPQQQAALLSALQALVATNPHLLRLSETNMGSSTHSANNGEQSTEQKPTRTESNNADDGRGDGDPDIVILDSSTVDAAAFRKPSTWQHGASDHEPSLFATNDLSPMPSSQGTESSPLPASTPPSGQENTPASSQMSTPFVGLESTPTVTPEAETPTSKGPTGRGNGPDSQVLDVPATPTPSRTRKRKLDEYVQGPTRVLPPSPSPSAPRTPGSRRGLTARRVQSSPVGGTMSLIAPARLPSMLSSMRTLAASGSRLGSLTHGSRASSKSINQQIAIDLGLPKSKTDHPGITDASLNCISSDATLKRRRTLNEFMAEHEARKKTKVRKRSSLAHKAEADLPTNVSQSTKLLSVSRNTQSSPPRPLFRSHSAASSSASARQSAFVPATAVTNTVWSTMTTLACAAPSTSTSTAVPAENPLKNFVLPAWARTNTAMLPRLSEEALARQRAEYEAKKAQATVKRREAAKAKRERLHEEERPSKESSDEDEEPVAGSAIPRTLLPPPPPVPSLPVFASDAVEPIPSSPPQPPRLLVPPVVPSTPPRKAASFGSAPHRTPSKSGSCSLFTPSGQDTGSLFTPSTPSITQRATFTPRSPTVLQRSSVKKSPRKSMMPQTPWTPRRVSGSHHQTPKSLRTGRHAPMTSPNMAGRTPQIQIGTGMGTRAFLLPPPSPCALRIPNVQRRVVPGSLTPTVPKDTGSKIDKQESASDKGCQHDDVLAHEPREALLGEDTESPLPQCSPGRPALDESQGTSGLRDVTSNEDTPQVEDEYASSPLPPSSPLPISPLSSPVKRNDNAPSSPTGNRHLVVPDSDVLLPSASDSAADADWLSDSVCPASWLTDSETSAWLTETEAWLTDTEGGPGGPLPTDSDAAWLSDSDAVFGDVSSFPPSSASNWLSDDADVDTDGECGGMRMEVERAGGEDFDAVAFEKAFAALVESGGQPGTDEGEGEGEYKRRRKHEGEGQGGGEVDSEFWTSIQPLLGGRAEVAAVAGPVDHGKAARDMQQLLDGLLGT